LRSAARSAFAPAAARTARALSGDGIYYQVGCNPNDGTANSSVRDSGKHVGRGVPERGAAPSFEIDDRPSTEQPWWEDGPGLGPQSQYGPLPRQDRPIEGAKPEGEAWDGRGPWPSDEWGAPRRGSDLLGIDPKLLDAFIEAGKAAGTVAADVTSESLAARKAKMDAANARAHTKYEGARQGAESATAQRVAAEAARERARADAVTAAQKGKTTAIIVLGGAGLLVATFIGIALFRRPAAQER